MHLRQPETCSHFSGPLSEGKSVGGSIESFLTPRFALEEGSRDKCQTVHPQPCLEVCIWEEQIEGTCLQKVCRSLQFRQSTNSERYVLFALSSCII